MHVARCAADDAQVPAAWPAAAAAQEPATGLPPRGTTILDAIGKTPWLPAVPVSGRDSGRG
jgi:hypothetical protein